MAVRLVGELEAAESRVRRRQVAPTGLVRSTVAPIFGSLYVVPRLHAFFARYPEIAVELLVTDRLVSLIEDGVDVAIHNGDLSDSTSIVRNIAATPSITVGTPAYLKKHGKPKSPSDLDQHACLIFVQRGAPRAWGFKGRFGNIAYQLKGPFRTNDAEQIRTDVLADLGLAHTPGWLFAGEIASGAVHRVLRAHKPAALSFSAVHPGGRRLASKVQAFIDFLAKAFADEPVLAIDQSV